MFLFGFIFRKTIHTEYNRPADTANDDFFSLDVSFRSACLKFSTSRYIYKSMTRGNNNTMLHLTGLSYYTNHRNRFIHFFIILTDFTYSGKILNNYLWYIYSSGNWYRSRSPLGKLKDLRIVRSRELFVSKSTYVTFDFIQNNIVSLLIIFALLYCLKVFG